jgi:hypothetical protein
MRGLGGLALVGPLRGLCSQSESLPATVLTLIVGRWSPGHGARWLYITLANYWLPLVGRSESEWELHKSVARARVIFYRNPNPITLQQL